MSDEQVSELRYIEELEAEVEKLQARNGCFECRATAERLREELKTSRLMTVMQKDHADRAEAKLAEVEELQTATQERLGDAYLTIERARELAEGKDVMGDVTGKHLNDRALLKEIARLLSGKAE